MKKISWMVWCAAATVLAQPPATTYRGYTEESTQVEAAWEKSFREIPQSDRLRENMRRLTARPHHVGSPYDKDNAEWLLAQLRSYGLEAKIEKFDALFPTPKLRKLELLTPVPFVARLDEPAIKEDATSAQKQEQLPTYNAYSHDGNVTAPLVYVNYGSPADYEQLERLGVSVKGAIVLARYGQVWRGLKPKLAAEHGAIGCIIYSDPKDDGYVQDEVYPAGPARPADGVQRGSVADIPVYPGDPQSPGVGAVQGAKLIPLDQVQTITKIPVLPISYNDATPLLKSLQGEVVPESWRGGLPLTYKVGPSKAQVHLQLEFNWDRQPLYDVIATIPGSVEPDQWVIRGNHHDAWVNGAGDPVSGASAELEEARALGELLKQGWKPRRTIIYAFWDGEEQGLLGSTEWAETHAEELSRHAVAYLNTDGSGRGFLHVEGSHSLENLVNSITSSVIDPETHISVLDRARKLELSRATAETRGSIKSRADWRIGALGSGSDYTPFLDHLGIPSLNFSFGGEDLGGGQYHSIYDDFAWYTRFADGEFIYGRALAQTVGSSVLRLADAELIPYQYTDFADTIRVYVGEVKKLADRQRMDAREINENIADGVDLAINDPRHPHVQRKEEQIPPYFNFAPLDQAIDDLAKAAADADKALAAAPAKAQTKWNEELLQAERTLIDPSGLPGRPWYEHLIYAPGLTTGYGVKTLPAVRESIEEKKWDAVDTQIQRTASALEAFTSRLRSIVKDVQ